MLLLLKAGVCARNARRFLFSGKIQAGPGHTKEVDMRKYFLFVMLSLACAGCGTIPNSVLPVASVVQPSERVTLGMTRVIVALIMDAKVIVGYEIDQVSGATKAIEVQNLFSSELMMVSGSAYQVDRYIVRPPMPGTRIAETDLFPVVYKDGLVVAKGREGLEQIRVAK